MRLWSIAGLMALASACLPATEVGTTVATPMKSPTSLTTLTQPVTSPEPVEWIEETHDWLRDRASGNEVSITVAVGGTCERLARVDVTESEASVTLEAIVERAVGPSVVCGDMMTFEEVTVTLREPLADRALAGCLLNEEDSYFDSTHGVERDTCNER